MMAAKTINQEACDKKTDILVQVEKERDLIARICDGDQNAFEKLYRIYYDRLYRFAYRMVGRVDSIDEVINDVMYVVWEKANSYNHRCRPSTWIFGIAYNKCLKSLRSLGTQTNNQPFDETSVEGKDFLGIVELENWLDHAFETLSPEQRSVVELVYVHGMHYQEIAKIMDCPENTVKTRMFYARKKLASVLCDTQD